jgi:cardiolipin synthase
MNALIVSVLIVAAQAITIVRAILRPHREPSSRIAWVVVIAAIPAVGVLIYLLFGEVNIGRRRVEKLNAVLARMPAVPGAVAAHEANLAATIPPHLEHLFKVARSINGFTAVGGNNATLLHDSAAAMDALVADIDAARDHVHLLFYIWLPDNNGLKVVEALRRAARRGVACRAMADDLGSRVMIRSEHWRALAQAGVRTAVALPIGNPFVRLLRGRIDVRNHRKIAVIDNRITYCGSQNCADAEFRIKAKYAPWVDAVMRFEGPIARQNQYVFAGDWTAQTDEALDDLLREPIAAPEQGFPAQVVATGPTVRYSAMPEMFESLLFAARREVVITTPYYVPDDSIHSALCAAAHRGVDARIVFPKRNDSWIVAAASRSYYADLLAAGVRIYEFSPGLLHTKSLTLDGEVTLIGSANMDRRSFDLNYENNILFADARLTREMRARQQEYIDCSEQLTHAAVESWSMAHRLRNNAIATFGPIL